MQCRVQHRFLFEADGHFAIFILKLNGRIEIVEIQINQLLWYENAEFKVSR